MPQSTTGRSLNTFVNAFTSAAHRYDVPHHFFYFWVRCMSGTKAIIYGLLIATSLLAAGCAPSQPSQASQESEKKEWADRLAEAENMSALRAEEALEQQKARQEQAARRGARSDEQVSFEAQSLEKELCDKAFLQWKLLRSTSQSIEKLPEGTPGEAMKECRVSQERANNPLSDPDKFNVVAHIDYPRRYGAPQKFLFIVLYEKNIDPPYALKVVGGGASKMDSR